MQNCPTLGKYNQSWQHGMALFPWNQHGLALKARHEIINNYFKSFMDLPKCFSE